jgi:hypothetical protein
MALAAVGERRLGESNILPPRSGALRNANITIKKFGKG